MAVAGELEALPFSSLIGGPLNAAIEAQGQAAKSSVEFIRRSASTATTTFRT